MSSDINLKKGALQSAAYDTVLQICLRVVSFVLNAMVVRYIGPAVLAVCSVRLLLLYSTTLLLTREAFRRAALAAKEHQVNYKLVNLIWASLTTLLPVGCILSYVWRDVMDPPPQEVLAEPSHYPACLVIILLSCAVELFAEVPFILAELQLWTKTRVMIEGAMQVVRSICIAGVVVVVPHYAVIGYSISHLIGSCVYCLSYYLVFMKAFRDKTLVKTLPFQTIRQLLPSRGPGEIYPRVEQETLKVTRGFLLQCWLKELLTEGEWFLMNLLPLVSLAQQGTYQVVSNLGALGARLVLRSIEAAAYKFFAQTLHREQPLELQDKKKVREAAQFLELLLRHLSLMSLVVLCFGYSYSHTLLQLYGGNALSSEGTPLMRAQCLLFVFLALNGVTEAYTFAAMNHKQLHWHSSLLVVFSVAYLAGAAGFTHLLGVVGFVWANCFNMALRIAHGWWFIERQYRPTQLRPLRGLRLSASSVSACAAAFIITAISEAYVSSISVVLHVAVGGVTFVLVLYLLREELEDVYTSALSACDRLLLRVGAPGFGVDREEGANYQGVHLSNCYLAKLHCVLYGKIRSDPKKR